MLLFNSRLKLFPGKLKTRWLGPYTVVGVHSYGSIEIQCFDGKAFKVNGERLKVYFGENDERMVETVHLIS